MDSLKPRFVTRREHQIDNYHGTLVADPYRWLEDDQSPEVQQWMADQNRNFNGYIETFAGRGALKARMTELWRFASSGVPSLIEGTYYVWRNDGTQNQPVLCRSASLDGPWETVLDINPFSEDGTVAVISSAFSPKGSYYAYGLSTAGSDWQVFRVLDLKTGQHLQDTLHHIKFSEICWLEDESGFVYARYPDPKAAVLASMAWNPALHIHILGQSQESDQLIYQDLENPSWSCAFSTDGAKKWAFLTIGIGTVRRNKLFFKPLDNMDSPWLPISDNFDGGYNVISVQDDVAYLYTQLEAPFGKVIRVSLSETGAGVKETVLPDQGEMLEWCKLVNGQLLCCFLHHACHQLRIFGLDGKLIREIAMPGLGSISESSVVDEGKQLFFSFSSFLSPNTVMCYDFEQGSMTTWFAPKVDFPFGDYETVQEFYPSKDGTRVPMFITRKKGLTLDGSHPTVLYGYGGYNLSRMPAFSVAVLTWLEQGGVHAEPCLRGGAEYGEAWHRGGMLESKQNVFDDFITAGEYLIAQGYTCNKKLGIMGRSNGGLLTGACVTQRPELFGAVIVWVPVLDMLRYHHFTSGHNWIGEFGCADDPEQFPYLYKYSPLHNVKMNTVYPPTLMMTANTDDRVVPCQARKFTATMQAADGGDNPIHIRIEKSAGHGQGKPISKMIEERTDLYSFFFLNLCK